MLDRQTIIRNKTSRTYKIQKNKHPCFSLCLTHINNKHEVGNIEQITELLKPCNKGVKINCWKSLFINVHQTQNLLIEKQEIHGPNPLFEMAHDAALHT